ncbi:MAG: septum formation initiator family protein [bacterium]|nr:septum formation initiator family protein [bacterium]
MRSRIVREENPIKSFFSKSKLFPVIGLILVILIGYPLAKKVKQRYLLNQEIAQLQEESDKLSKKNKELENIIDYLGSEGFIESQARLNLDLKKPGESVVVIKDELAERTNEENKSIYVIDGLDKELPKAELSNPRQWWQYFFGEKNNES